MIGLIVTGHGNFASGLTSALDLIAGSQKDYAAVDFLPTHTTDDLQGNIEKAIEELSDCNGIIIMCDLPGASPFNVSGMVTKGRKDIVILAGVNMPMLCEITMTRAFEDDIDKLVNAGLEMAKTQAVKFELKVNKPADNTGEGI